MVLEKEWFGFKVRRLDAPWPFVDLFTTELGAEPAGAPRSNERRVDVVRFAAPVARETWPDASCAACKQTLSFFGRVSQAPPARATPRAPAVRRA